MNKETLEKALAMLEDPEFIKQMAEDFERAEKETEQEISDMYATVGDMSDGQFNVFVKVVNDQKYNSEDYCESTSDEWTLVRLAYKYGRELSDDELDKLDNMFLSEAYEYKGYYFGIMSGQGSIPWYRKVVDVE